MSTRLTMRTGRVPANPPTRPPARTSTIPARNTRRGPNTSATLPDVGWAIALARYRADTSAAVCPTGTPAAAAIGTSAVAISELLIGLSADPMNSGAVNCQGKTRALAGGRARSGRAEVNGARLLDQVGEVLDHGRGGPDERNVIGGVVLGERVGEPFGHPVAGPEDERVAGRG